MQGFPPILPGSRVIRGLKPAIHATTTSIALQRFVRLSPQIRVRTPYNSKQGHAKAFAVRFRRAAARRPGDASGVARLLQLWFLRAGQHSADLFVLGRFDADLRPDGHAGLHPVPYGGEALHRAAKQPARLAYKVQADRRSARAYVAACYLPGAMERFGAEFESGQMVQPPSTEDQYGLNTSRQRLQPGSPGQADGAGALAGIAVGGRERGFL